MIPAVFSLEGRAALVTGAGSPTGIGFASARLLGELGAAVVVTSTTERIFDRVDELRGVGLDAHGATADLTDPAQVTKVMADVGRCVGRADILINNAGMTSLTDPGPDEAGATETMALEMWHSSLSRNLDTAFLMTQAALGSMKDQHWGRIVSVSSVTGPVMAMRHEPAYAAAKAGMVGLMRSVAIDYGPYGITANAVAPGWIATGSQTDDEAREGTFTPVGRSATPNEVASAIAWLASPGGGYVTGQCIVVDGGNSIAEQRR